MMAFGERGREGRGGEGAICPKLLTVVLVSRVARSNSSFFFFWLRRSAPRRERKGETSLMPRRSMEEAPLWHFPLSSIYLCVCDVLRERGEIAGGSRTAIYGLLCYLWRRERSPRLPPSLSISSVSLVGYLPLTRCRERKDDRPMLSR